MEADTITPEDRKRLDRQRFIGWETQKKLLSSRVLITPANGPNTQLAKNLILSGVNVTLYDHATVTEDDFQSNFLIAESDIGRLRAEAVFDRLKEMNPNGKNQVFCQNLLQNFHKQPVQWFSRFSLIATSTQNFGLISSWDNLTKKLNLPYFNSICCGLHGFAFISLGQNYHYKQLNKEDKTVNKIWQIRSLAVEQCLDWTKAEKNKQFIAAIKMMRQSQRKNLKFDPFNPNEQILRKIVQQGVQQIGQKHRQFLLTFARTFNIDYCPVYSVIGSILSQQVIKIAQNQNEPAVNWLVFNSEEGYGNVVRLSMQKEMISSRVPE